jgi:hypothetical protein
VTRKLFNLTHNSLKRFRGGGGSSGAAQKMPRAKNGGRRKTTVDVIDVSAAAAKTSTNRNFIVGQCQQIPLPSILINWTLQVHFPPL